MKRRTLVMLLGAVALVAACTPASESFKADGYTQMRGDDIRAALLGNSLSGTDSDGDYVIYYPDASRMRIEYQNRRETGVWRIEGDKYCRRWETFGNGKERCVTMFRKGDRIDWVQDGRITDRSVRLKGNPNGL